MEISLEVVIASIVSVIVNQKVVKFPTFPSSITRKIDDNGKKERQIE